MAKSPPVNIAVALRRRVIGDAVIAAERDRAYAEGFDAGREACMAEQHRLKVIPGGQASAGGVR